MNPKTVIIFHHLGPYHLARIKSLLSKFSDIIVIELASRVNARDWERPKIEGFELVTLVDDVYENIPPKKLVQLLKETIEKVRPECIVTSGYSHPAMRAAAKWAKKQDRAVTVLLSESQYVDHKRNVFKEYLKKTWIKKYYDAAFVGGTSAASYLQNMGFPSNRIWRGYNVVDNAFFRSMADSVRENPEKIRRKLGLPARFFLYVGRFSEEKNLMRLLAGYKRYLSDAGNEAWGLVMAGSGPKENKLRAAAALLGLKDIRWPGFVQIDDLPNYYALASGFILPSVRDPWGLVVNEAMASGLPVLVSIKCGCAFDLLVPGVNGKIFDPNSELEIAGAIKWLSYEGRDLQAMGDASKQIVSHYSPYHWSRALGDCISTIPIV